MARTGRSCREESGMNTQRRGQKGLVLGLALAALSGCQTYVMETTQTLPSGFYLNHLPQYIPPSPQYPLGNELAALVDATARPEVLPAPAALIPGGGLPPPAPFVPGGGPPPPPGGLPPPAPAVPGGGLPPPKL